MSQDEIIPINLSCRRKDNIQIFPKMEKLWERWKMIKWKRVGVTKNRRVHSVNFVFELHSKDDQNKRNMKDLSTVSAQLVLLLFRSDGDFWEHSWFPYFSVYRCKSLSWGLPCCTLLRFLQLNVSFPLKQNKSKHLGMYSDMRKQLRVEMHKWKMLYIYPELTRFHRWRK
jgi:hypothetical protein